MPPTCKALLNDRYQIVSSLGRGGFGETYLAHDTHRPSHPNCVVKRLQPLMSSHPEYLNQAKRLFDQEAAVLERLGHHDQIPTLLAHFEEEQEFYLVQEFVDGQPLSTELSFSDASATAPVRWTEAQVIRLLEDVLQILEFVHQQGIIHRDIKPENIMRRRQDDRLVLIDFGAVKHLNSSANYSSQATLAISTAGYTPIEQLRGNACPSSDLYALGMIAIQALTGLHPKSFEENLHLNQVKWTAQAQISPAFTSVLRTLVRYHWGDRYQTATEALQALQSLRAPSSFTAESYTPTSAALLQSETLPPDFEQAVNDPTPLTQARRKLRSSVEPIAKARKRKSARAIARLFGVAMIAAGLAGLGFIVVDRLTPAFKLLNSQSLEPTQPDLLTAIFQARSPVYTLTFSPDGKTVISNGANSTIVVWDVQMGDALQTLANHTERISAVAVSPDRPTLITGSTDKTIKVWHLQRGELLDTFADYLWSVLAIAISPDGKTLASSYADQTIKVWNLERHELLYTLSGHSAISALDISLDNSLMVGGSTDHTIKVWNLHAQQLLQTLKGHSGAVNAVAISSNSAVLVSGSADGTVKTWNLYTGQLLQTLKAHWSEVSAIALSPDGRTIISGSDDGTIKLWDLASGRLLSTLTGHIDAVRSIALSPDGQAIASGSLDGTIRIWRMP